MIRQCKQKMSNNGFRPRQAEDKGLHGKCPKKDFTLDDMDCFLAVDDQPKSNQPND